MAKLTVTGGPCPRGSWVGGGGRGIDRWSLTEASTPAMATKVVKAQLVLSGALTLATDVPGRHLLILVIRGETESNCSTFGLRPHRNRRGRGQSRCPFPPVLRGHFTDRQTDRRGQVSVMSTEQPLCLRGPSRGRPLESPSVSSGPWLTGRSGVCGEAPAEGGRRCPPRGEAGRRAGPPQPAEGPHASRPPGRVSQVSHQGHGAGRAGCQSQSHASFPGLSCYNTECPSFSDAHPQADGGRGPP